MTAGSSERDPAKLARERFWYGVPIGLPPPQPLVSINGLIDGIVWEDL